MTELRGITWNHTRGYTPLVACAQRFGEIHPDVTVTWARRSLVEFGEMPVEELAQRFDLLVIDHPFIGQAARRKVFRPLDGLLQPAVIAGWQQVSVGGSTDSYRYDAQTWAAPIDAACPVAVWREDLLSQAGTPPPRDWAGLLVLAKRGLVLIPGMHTDAIHHFYMLLLALGAEPGVGEETIAPVETCAEALEELARLYALVPETCQHMNPIAVHEALAREDSAQAYCPFAFGYSNYSRRSYAPRTLRAGPPPRWRTEFLRTTLGGTGLAIAAGCLASEWAARFVEFVAAGETQRGLYWQTGGQPAHRSAWTDEANNAETAGYLAATLPTLDAAWVRPRFPGYLHFQDQAAHVVHEAACRRKAIPAAVEQMNALWREARRLRLHHAN